MMENACKPLRVALLAGGDSSEREISLASGRAVDLALRAAGHTVIEVDPAHTPLGSLLAADVDVCFIALHGGAGEDGRVQEQLEILGIPYTGSGPDASRLAMSKSASKERFRVTGVPTAPWTCMCSEEPVSSAAVRCEELGYPLVLKPDRQGSSIGVAVVRSVAELPEKLDVALQYDDLVVAEPFLPGREFTVALIDRRPLPLIEIVTAEALFSFAAKYGDTRSEHRFDHGLDQESTNQLQEIAVAAADALGTSGLQRVDIRLNGRGELCVLEVNTVPGMTPCSLAPEAAARVGLDMVALCDRCVRNVTTVARVS